MFRQLFDREYRRASAAAREFLVVDGTEISVHQCKLRAEEESRFVFAVFYTTPDKRIKPVPYQLVACDKGSFECQVLNPDRNSPYWIRGRK